MMKSETIRYRKLKLPYNVPYRVFKKQILHCHVQVTRLECSDAFSEPAAALHDKLPELEAENGNTATTLSPPEVVLDLEKYDSSSQLILLSLLTRQPSKFRKHVSEATNSILQKCAEILKYSQDFNSVTFLQEALESKRSASREKTTAIIFAIMMDYLRTKEFEKIAAFLDLVVESDINCDQVEILDPKATKTSACFLMLEMILKMKNVKSCVRYMRNQNLIQQLLKIGNIARDSYIMYGELLSTIMKRAYQSQKIHSAIHVFNFNLNLMKTPPPCSNTWGPLMLATVLSKAFKGDTEHVYSIASNLLSRGVSIPHRLQRAAFVHLKRAQCKDSDNLFKRSPVYQLASNLSISSSPTISIDSEWTEDEMKASFEQARQAIVLTKSEADEVNFRVNINKVSAIEDFPSCLVQPVEMLTQKYLSNDVEEPLQRLSGVIEEIRLELPKKVSISINLFFRGTRS